MASGLESEFVTLHEIVKAAKIRLNPNIWDYLIGGTETETTLRRNRMALDSIAFKPRVLRNVSKIDPSSEILGKKMRLPLMLAPVGSLESFEPGGGITVATLVARSLDCWFRMSSNDWAAFALYGLPDAVI